MKILKWIPILFFSVIGIGCLYTESNKFYWDNKVDNLCKKDGGIYIYEKVQINKTDYPNSRYTHDGLKIIPPFELKASVSDPFYISHSTEFIKRGHLDVMKHETSIVRNSDKKILATKIGYGRRGGDLPTGLHPSHHSCEFSQKDHVEFENVIQVIY